MSHYRKTMPALATKVEEKPLRYRADCPACSYHAVRSKRDAAEHAVAVHHAYAHEWEASQEV